MSSNAPLEANIVLSSSASTNNTTTLSPQEIERICKAFIRLITAPEIDAKELSYDNQISTKATHRDH